MFCVTPGKNVPRKKRKCILLGLKKEGNSDVCYNVGEPKDIRLSEIGPSQKDKYGLIPLMRYLEQSNSQQKKVKWWLPGAWGEGRMGNCC